jgi:hypothetical protein
MKVWLGTSDRAVLVTNGPRFYFSTRLFGWRLRVWFIRGPHVTLGRA